MMISRSIFLRVTSLLISVLFLSPCYGVDLTKDSVLSGSAMISKAQINGRLPVIVQLKVDTLPEGLLTSNARSIQKDKIKNSRTTLLKKLNKYKPTRIKKFQHLPMTAMEIDPEGLKALLTDFNVAAVYEDRLVKSTLTDSTSLIGSTSSTTSGADGNGQVVAILDTGVDSNHPFLSGKVVHEACFSKTTSSSTSVCPDGNNSQIGSGAAIPCSIGGCTHGTHVAGIAAGKGTGFSGVAPEANIMAVQVFSRFEAENCSGSSPCVLSYTSDLISGLEHVYSQKSNFNISAVNMSLGGGNYPQACDDTQTPMKAAIDLLRSVGIATVVASGNDGYTNALSFPACISSAISVGATSKSDSVASYSNSVDILDILAPGSSIQSSVPGTGYSSMSGTSMATPHVAGAFAALRSKQPTGSIDEFLSVMKSTGIQITDTRNNIIKPRLQLDLAAQSFSTFNNISHDFDPDGKADIFWRHSVVGINWMYHMDGSNLSDNNPVNQVTDPDWEIAGIGDLDNDGDADILWRHAITGLNVIYLMSGSTINGSLILNTVSDLNWKVVGLGDFNGDGTEDILWRHAVTGINYLYIMDNAAILSHGPINTLSDQNWKVAGLADFNADGYADILWRHATTGQNWIYLMNSSQIASSVPLNIISDLDWEVVGLGDRNGDGNSDIIWRHSTNGMTWSYLMDGNNIVSSEPLVIVANNWEIKQTSDFDGDGKSDILWRDMSSGLNWIYLMNGNTIVQSNPLNFVDTEWKVVGL